MRTAEVRLTLAVVAARNGELDHALSIADEALSIRPTVPPVIADARHGAGRGTSAALPDSVPGDRLPGDAGRGDGLTSYEPRPDEHLARQPHSCMS